MSTIKAADGPVAASGQVVASDFDLSLVSIKTAGE
jgi:hypothetical protein